MSSVLKQHYPQTDADTVAYTITLASLASNTNLLVGRESTVVDNRTNLDEDHLLSGKIKMGGSAPTLNNRIEVWVYGPMSASGGTPTYPDTVTGADAGITLVSDNVKFCGFRQVWGCQVDASANRVYPIPPTSIAALFGGQMPPWYGIIVFNGSGQALSSTGSDHYIGYERIQKTVV